MKFVYDNKESYSQAELDKILEQHKGFVSKDFKEYVAPEDHKKILDELKPFKTKARVSHISSLVGELTSENKLGDAISLSGITDEDDDATIKTKVGEAIKSRPWLQKDTGTPLELKKDLKKPEIKKEPTVKRRFANN